MSITDPNQPASSAPTHTVKIDGQDRVLTQEELHRLAQQGSQAAANAERNRELQAQLDAAKADAGSWRELRQNFEQNPEYMMGWLGDHYGFSVAPSGTPAVDPNATPEELEIAQLKRKVEQLKTTTEQGLMNTQRSIAIDRESAALQAKYPEANLDEVMSFAGQHKMPEGTLEIAYNAMMQQRNAANSNMPPADPTPPAAPAAEGTPPVTPQQQQSLADQKLANAGNVLPGSAPAEPRHAAEPNQQSSAGDPLHSGTPKPKRRSLKDSMDLAYQNNPEWDPNATPARPDDWW